MHNQKNSGIAVFYSKQNLKNPGLYLSLCFLCLFLFCIQHLLLIFMVRKIVLQTMFFYTPQTIKIPSYLSLFLVLFFSLDSSSDMSFARLTLQMPSNQYSRVGAAIIPTPRSKKTIVNILPPSVIGTTSPGIRQ